MHCPRKCLKVSNVNFPWFNDVGCVPGISSVVWLCNLRGVFPRFVTLGPSSHPSRRLSTAGGCPGVLRASRRAEEETETGHGIGDGDDQNKVTEKSKQGIAVVRWIDGQMEDPNSITSRASHTHTHTRKRRQGVWRQAVSCLGSSTVRCGAVAERERESASTCLLRMRAAFGRSPTSAHSRVDVLRVSSNICPQFCCCLICVYAKRHAFCV